MPFEQSAFPEIPNRQRRKTLTLPKKRPVRVVVDSDVANEVDDFFALAWILRSPEIFHLEAVYAAPFSFAPLMRQMIQADKILERGGPKTKEQKTLVARNEEQIDALAKIGLTPEDLRLDPHVAAGPARGMKTSFVAAQEIFTVLGAPSEGRVFHGSDRYLGHPAEAVESPAALDLVERARASSPDDPLYVLAIACVTNIASAILLAPDIIPNIVVIWTAGFPTNVLDLPNTSFNLEQDLPASQLLFSCGVPLVYLPGFYIGQQLGLSLPEVEKWVRGQGAAGDLLYQRFVANPLFPFYGILSAGLPGFDWTIWDIIVPAWLLGLVPTTMRPTPTLTDKLYWRPRPEAPLLLEATNISRSGIFEAFFSALMVH